MKIGKILLIILVPLFSFSEDLVSPVITLENLVKELLLLKKEIHAEETCWKEERSFLLMQQELLVQEKELLQKKISALKAGMEGAITEIHELEKKHETNESVLEQLSLELSSAEERITAILKPLPESLVSSINPLLNRLRMKNEQNVSEKLDTILSILSEINRLQHTVTLKKEILWKTENNAKEFDVLYLGLWQAFCVSSDDQIAGFGLFSSKGLAWHWDPSISKTIRKAILVFTQKQPAELVSLPLQINKKARS